MKAKDEKHRLFARLIVEGKTQTDAYKIAYPHSVKWQAKSITNKAYQLSILDDVKTMIEEFKKEVTKEFVWKREASLKVLASIALSKTAKNPEKISAVKELNVMYGYNSPQKIDLSSSDGTMSPKGDLTHEELLQTLEHYGIKADQ